MRIAILGAGLTGAYLYRRLAGQGRRVEVFGKDPGTRCGISPCAWGTSCGFAELVKEAGLDASAYTLSYSDYVCIDEIRLKADLITIDKQKLIQDLLQGARISREQPDVRFYDRVIDATGVSRALLPQTGDDLILSCIQFRVSTDETLDNRAELGGIGYAWCFPLSGGEYHIGCGSFVSDPLERLKALGWIGGNGSRRKIICGCKGDIRLASPHACLPFVVGEKEHQVWGVGEAIGCVAPLAGDGIVPGLKSARMLLERWDDPDGYTAAVLKEFGWMKKERAVVDKLRRGEKLGLDSAWVVKRNSKRMGIEVGLKEASAILRRLI